MERMLTKDKRKGCSGAWMDCTHSRSCCGSGVFVCPCAGALSHRNANDGQDCESVNEPLGWAGPGSKSGASVQPPVAVRCEVDNECFSENWCGELGWVVVVGLVGGGLFSCVCVDWGFSAMFS